MGDVHEVVEAIGVDDEMTANIRYGGLATVLPYLMQDAYRRDLRDTSFAVAVLENEVLRATFLLDLGGRLWSLVHKPSGRELLHRNPIFQPANLALRNAWFAGGVEWNISATGHSPLTCSPVHAARVTRPDGTPVLRLYEWERIREVVYALDFWLPDGSPVLLVQVSIVNPNPHEVPMYWWSNIAVPETDEVRVLAPADSAFQFSYDRKLRVVPVPVHNGEDVTYPAGARHAADFFFDVRGTPRPWVAALDGSGAGLVQASSSDLGGRKLFVWGREPGGRRWQEFLSGPGSAYCEIQAGLARTQFERLPMSAGARWSWVEAYGLLQVDPEAVHGQDWAKARHATEQALDALVSLDELTAALADARQRADRPPDESLHDGSGWGALERRRRAAANEPPIDLPGTPFSDHTLGPEQALWVELLEEGRVPDGVPRSYVVGPAWRAALDAAEDSPAAWLHRGVAAWAAGGRKEARAAWSRSEDSPWALRNLAVTAADPSSRADLLVAARAGLPHLLPLTLETLRALLAAGRPGEVIELIDSELVGVDDGRVGVLEIEAALALGDLERAEATFDRKFVVAQLREGERSLSELWFAYQEARAARATGQPVDDQLRARLRHDHPVPSHYDFGME